MLDADTRAKWIKILKSICDDPTVLTLRGIYRELGCGEKKVNDIINIDPEIADAVDYARTIIGVRREEMALRGQLAGDTNVCRSTMPVYDLEYRNFLIELKKYKEELKEPIEIKIIRYDEPKSV